MPLVTPQVEGEVLGDLLKWETDRRYGREVHPVLTGQTLVLGDVCEFDLTKTTEKKLVSTAVDEVQTVTVGGTSSGGTLKLGFKLPDGSVAWTDTIAWSATEATMTASVNTALDNLLGSSAVVCGTIADTASLVMVLTFSGTGYTELPQDPVHVDVSVLTGASTVAVAETTKGHAAGGLADSICLGPDGTANDEVQSVVFGGTPTGGTFAISMYDKNGVLKTTTVLVYNASAATITTALGVALGLTNACVATGSTLPDQTITFTYSGTDYSGRAFPLLSIDTALLTGGTPTAVESRTTAGGYRRALFLVRGPAIVDYGVVNYNSTTEATVNALLETLGIQVRTGPTYTKLSDQ